MNHDLEAIAAAAAEAFREAPPNGWLLGWPERRYEDALSSLCIDAEAQNVTGFDYSYCNAYKFLFAGGRIGDVCEVLLDISFVADAYQVHAQLNKTSGRGSPLRERALPNPGREFVADVREFLNTRGFLEIDAEMGQRTVRAPALELCESEMAPLNRCLFHDYAD